MDKVLIETMLARYIYRAEIHPLNHQTKVEGVIRFKDGACADLVSVALGKRR